MSKILVTGGAGFIGSHIAEYYASRGYDVVAFDNLSRHELLKYDGKNSLFNWNFLGENFKNVTRIKGDIRDFTSLKKAMEGTETVFHTAAQTAVTTSVVDPMEDFSVNAVGTFNVVESARQNKVKNLVYCSTNKVYGDNVNNVKLIEEKKRYSFEESFSKGIPESFSIDHCEHTPYGCSKLTADLYVQDYARLYGIKTGVFRMSCIYGTRQFGVEDQGWVAWFSIATLLNKPITIYGDGKQVRDILYVSDLVRVFDAFVNKKDLNYGVFNMGGGNEKTISLHELVDLIETKTGKRQELKFDSWRPSDQKVYISDITKAKTLLNWTPKVTPEEGVNNLIEWIQKNKVLFI